MANQAKKRRAPQIVLENGEPSAVIVDIADYRELLERLEDVDDLRELEGMRQRPLKYRTLNEFLAEYKPNA